jgi:hypothetical protein
MAKNKAIILQEIFSVIYDNEDYFNEKEGGSAYHPDMDTNKSG